LPVVNDRTRRHGPGRDFLAINSSGPKTRGKS